MFRSFFKIAIRNLSKNKFFTLLNVIGLALGMSLSLLYVALLVFLSGYDGFHPLKDRIYRVTTQVNDNIENPRYASAPAGIAQKIQEGITGVEKAVRIDGSLGGEAIYHEKKIGLQGYFADPEFLQVFNFPLLRGNKLTALNKPNALVISESEATKFFGKKDAMGEVISMAPYGDFVITGIFKDLPVNSHMQFDAVASYATLRSYKGTAFPEYEESWKSFSNSYVYLLLSEGTEPGNIEHDLKELARQKYAKQQIKASFALQSLHKIVPGPELYNPIGPNWGYQGLLILGLLTLIVLVPACSNYASLAISQSLERMKEIGVRKVMGGQKKQIFSQFIVESVIIVLLALLLSYPLFEIIRGNLLSQLVETSPMDLSPTLPTFTGFFLFAVVVGMAAGIVPALYFSRLSPISALKGKEVKSSGGSFFRKLVLTLQFVLSLGFIMAVIIVIRQYQYSVNYDFGFEQQNVLDVELQHVDPQLFKNEYGKIPSVHSISMSSHILGIGAAAEQQIKTPDLSDSIEASSMSIDEDYISNMKLKLLAGKGFGENGAANSRLIVVNEEFVKSLHLKDPFAALNRSFVLTDGREVRIAGVLKDFHYAGLKEPVKNFFFEYTPDRFVYANLKLKSGGAAGNLQAMERAWKKLGGEGKFTAQLFSAEIKEAYSFYKTMMKLWGFLGLLAITVACLGLLGTVTFTIKKRVKEIGIRKVMGASSESLVFLLSKDFISLVLIASIFTVPAVYFLMDHLLVSIQHYSVQIGFLEIFASVTLILFLGLTTILSQTLKAAHANPVHNLRTE
ncbi:MAG: ABC transporter permease [Williamsia sp.]|nr:ABC transporter permease [Williamsia sp.]